MFDGKPYKPPSPPPLPIFGVTEAPFFTYIGIDFVGSLYIKGVENHKVCICLYTCCVIKAIYLEMVPKLRAQAFLRCFKRFTARRGFPCKIISDNAKTFKSTKKALLTMLDNLIVHRYFADV